MKAESIFCFIMMVLLLFTVTSINVKAQSPPPQNLVSVGNRTLDLLIKLSQDRSLYTKELFFRLYDAKTNHTIQHVGYFITITKGHFTLLRDLFHTNSGILILRINPDTTAKGPCCLYNSNLNESTNATRELLSNGLLADYNDLVYVNASGFVNDGSIYHINTQIESMDKDSLFFYPQDRPIFDFFTRLDVNDNQQTWIPGWFKNVANWYSEDLISGRDLANSMEYLIEQGILQISQTQSNNTMTDTFPAGIKENAQKWSENVVSDNDFSKTIQFLINDGIINLNSY